MMMTIAIIIIVVIIHRVACAPTGTKCSRTYAKSTKKASSRTPKSLGNRGKAGSQERFGSNMKNKSIWDLLWQRQEGSRLYASSIFTSSAWALWDNFWSHVGSNLEPEFPTILTFGGVPKHKKLVSKQNEQVSQKGHRAAPGRGGGYLWREGRGGDPPPLSGHAWGGIWGGVSMKTDLIPVKCNSDELPPTRRYLLRRSADLPLKADICR